MKNDLNKYIKEIFYCLGITESFEVFDCNNDTLPEWAKKVELTNEFLVCCQDFSLREKLQIFTGKSIFENGKYIYWFEGEKIVEPKIPLVIEPGKIEEEKIEFLKTKTRLPACLDDFIFNHLKAVYAPDFQRFEYNLNLSGEDILKYLGTYFPRSYAESFCIFDNIFQNIVYRETITNKMSLNILSVGCGTGGDLVGLITAVEKNFNVFSEINIWAIDGNIEALTIFEEIINKMNSQSSTKMNLHSIGFEFDCLSNFELENLQNLEFDFILSFKFVGEIISLGKGAYDHSYYDFIHKFLPLLSNDGLFVLLDVTTKPKHSTYYPILMNDQINKALRELSKYKTLLPIPCSVFCDSCFYECFQQKTFIVSHSRHPNDKSRVAYRVIVSESLWDKVGCSVIYSTQLINSEKVCPFSEDLVLKNDAYFLRQNTIRI